VTRFGLIQMRCEKGAIAENLGRITDYLAEAAARQVDIVGFPEMCLTGYADPIRYPEMMLNLNGPEIAQFLHVTRKFSGTVLAGFIETNPDGKPFITQIAARNGALSGYYRKITIRDEEVEWFSAGQAVPVFYHDDLCFGMAICADLKNPEVFSQISNQGARLVFELAAPGLYGAQETRDWQASFAWWEGECENYLGSYAHDYGAWILVATQAGRTVDEDFPGGAFVFAPGGKRVFATPDGSEGAVFLEIDLSNGAVRELG
jgi:predicted amidohydrolase